MMTVSPSTNRRKPNSFSGRKSKIFSILRGGNRELIVRFATMSNPSVRKPTVSEQVYQPDPEAKREVSENLPALTVQANPI